MGICEKDANELKALLLEFHDCTREIDFELEIMKTEIKNAQIYFNSKNGSRKKKAETNFSLLPNVTQIGTESRPKRKAARNASKIMNVLVSDNIDAGKMRRPTIASSTGEKIKMAVEMPQNEFLHPGAVGNVAKGLKTKQTRRTKAADATRVLNEGGNQTYDIHEAGPSRASTRKKRTKAESHFSSKDETSECEESRPKRLTRNTRAASQMKQSVVKETEITSEDSVDEVKPKRGRKTGRGNKTLAKESEEAVGEKSRRNTRAASQMKQSVVKETEITSEDSVDEVKPKRGRKTARGNKTLAKESEEAVGEKSRRKTRAASRVQQSVHQESDVSENEEVAKRARKTKRGNKNYPEKYENTDSDVAQQSESRKSSGEKPQFASNSHPELVQCSSSGNLESIERSDNLKTAKSNRRSRSDDRAARAEESNEKRSLSSSRITPINTPAILKKAQNFGLTRSAKPATPSKIPLSRSTSAKRKQDEISEQKKKDRELLYKKIKEEEAQKKLQEGAAKKMLKEEEVLRKKEALMNDKKEILRKKNIEKTQVAANKEALEREKREEMERLESEKEIKERLKKEELEKEREAQILKKKELQKKKFLEVEERRLKDEAARLAKLKEIEEEQKRQAEIVLKQKEEATRLLQERKFKEEEKKIQKAAPKVLKEVQNVPYEDYGMDSDIEDERKPKKPIPDWAKGATLAKTVAIQNALYLSDLVDRFFEAPQTMPDVKKLFGRCALVRARTSSACWSNPLNE